MSRYRLNWKEVSVRTCWRAEERSRRLRRAGGSWRQRNRSKLMTLRWNLRPRPLGRHRRNSSAIGGRDDPDPDASGRNYDCLDCNISVSEMWPVSLLLLLLLLLLFCYVSVERSQRSWETSAAVHDKVVSLFTWYPNRRQQRRLNAIAVVITGVASASGRLPTPDGWFGWHEKK